MAQMQQYYAPDEQQGGYAYTLPTTATIWAREHSWHLRLH